MIFKSKQYCLNINYKFQNEKNFRQLHSQDPSDDFLEIDDLINKTLSQNQRKIEIPCLVSFNIWQERDINFLGQISLSIENLKSQVKESLYYSDTKSECERDRYGIFMNDTCHYY